MAQDIRTGIPAIRSKSPSFIDGVSKKMVTKVLRGLKVGSIRIVTDGEMETFGIPGSELEAALHIHNPTAYRAIAFGGSVGAGKAYIQGKWSSPGLVQLIRVFARNLDVVDQMESGTARIFTGLLKAIYGITQRNTKEGSKENIYAHYDLGNDLFELFLDEKMMYSCAIYPSSGASLERAQTYRLDRIGSKLQLTKDDHLLEIGSGWGGLAVHLAETFGCRVTTTTISKEQYDLTIERVKRAGLQDRVEVLLEDYRDLKGTYDKLVSIEMIEAVGHEFYDEYFKTCSNLLKEGGLMLIQAILIDDRRYEAARKEVDYIKHYIFPGSCIPSMKVINESVTRSTDLSLVHNEDITRHYVKTLRDWRHRFLDQRKRLNSMGYDDEFVRMWEFYFAYCEAGFLERNIRTAQIMMAKPRCDQDSVLGEFV